MSDTRDVTRLVDAHRLRFIELYDGAGEYKEELVAAARYALSLTEGLRGLIEELRHQAALNRPEGRQTAESRMYDGIATKAESLLASPEARHSDRLTDFDRLELVNAAGLLRNAGCTFEADKVQAIVDRLAPRPTASTQEEPHGR